MILSRSRSKAEEAPYSFQERFRNIQRIAIIYPEKNEWLRIARYTLQNLYSLPDRFEFLILTPADTERPKLHVPHAYEDMVYQPGTAQFADVNSKIAAFNPELLLQLEPAPSVKLERAILSLNVPLKIGFGTERSGLNIVYSQKPTGFYEKNLLNLISLLRLKS